MYFFLANAFGKTSLNVWRAFNNVERVVMAAGSIACGLACVWIGNLFSIPREPGFNGSLLLVAPGAAIVSVIVALAISTIVAWVIAKYIDVQCGLFCVCMGLAALAVRCGPVRPVLQYATGAGVFLSMALETILLGAGVYGVWWLLIKLLGGPNEVAAPNEVVAAPVSQKLMATAVQVVVMSVCELILVQNDAKAQAMAGAGISAFLGVMAAYLTIALPQGFWYWIGPICVGVIGYLIAFFLSPGISVGDVHGWAAALARPTPLDYAGMGTGGALLGYWCSRRWAQPEEDASEPAVA